MKTNAQNETPAASASRHTPEPKCERCGSVLHNTEECGVVVRSVPTFGLEAKNLTHAARQSIAVIEKIGLRVTSVRRAPSSSMVVHTVQDNLGNCILNRVQTNTLTAFADGIAAVSKYALAGMNPEAVKGVVVQLERAKNCINAMLSAQSIGDNLGDKARDIVADSRAALAALKGGAK